MVTADRTHLYNMLSNLIGNAIKYSGEKPCRITIRGAVSPKETVLSVTDEGIGISEANLKRIFDKFYRVPNGNLHDVKGFGMAELIIRIKALLNKASVKKKAATSRSDNIHSTPSRKRFSTAEKSNC